MFTIPIPCCVYNAHTVLCLQCSYCIVITKLILCCVNNAHTVLCLQCPYRVTAVNSPWLRGAGWDAGSPLTEHWEQPSGTRVTWPLWFSNTQCSLSRSRPWRTTTATRGLPSPGRPVQRSGLRDHGDRNHGDHYSRNHKGAITMSSGSYGDNYHRSIAIVSLWWSLR